MTPRKEIVILLCFARSGGTLLNKCLGVMPRTVVLSEVNPLGGGWGARGAESYTTVKEQAKQWLGISIESDDFTEAVLEVYWQLEERGVRLVVRDWSFVNFVPYENNNWNPPNRLLTLETISKKWEVIPFAFIRDAIDVWISLGMPEIEQFSEYYLAYLNCIKDKKIKVFKYEEFCTAPKKIMKNICDFTGLEFSPHFINSYKYFSKVSGDVQIKEGSRGTKQRKIKRLPRGEIPEDKILEINRCKKIQFANEINCYPTTYGNHRKKRRFFNMNIFKR